MRTNIEINDKLIKTAKKLTGLSTKKDVVNYALLELVKKREQIDPRTLLGIIKIDPVYNYKNLRKG